MDKKIIYITNVTYEVDSDGFEPEDGYSVESYPASVSLGAIPIYNEAQLIEGNTYLVQQKSPKTGQYSGKLNSCVLVGKEKSLGGDYSLLFEGSLGRFSFTLTLKRPYSKQGIYYSIFQRKEGQNKLINLSSPRKIRGTTELVSQIYLNSDGKLKQMPDFLHRNGSLFI